MRRREEEGNSAPRPLPRPPDGAAAGEILEYSWERRVARRLPLRPPVPPVSVRQKQQWNFNFGFAYGARHCRAMSLNDLSRTAARGNKKECMQRVSNFPSPSVKICTQLTNRSPQPDIGSPTHSIIFFISFRSEDIERQPRNRKTTAVDETWSPSN